MLGFWKFFLDNRAFTYFLVMVTVLAGVYALATIPKESTPEVTLPIASVTTSYFGASAGDVETLVTDVIEQRIENLSGVDSYESTSVAGLSQIIVTFNQGEDIDERVTRLKEQVDVAAGDLPADGNDPMVRKIEFSSQPIYIVSLVSELPLYSFKQVVDETIDEILTVDGVAEVTVSGIPEREVSVITDNRRLEQYGLDFNRVTSLLSQSNITLPGGSIVMQDIEYPVSIASEVDDVDELQYIPLSYRDSGTVVLADVATVRNGFRPQETITQVGYPGGETLNAVTLNISKKNGGDITQLSAEIDAVIAGLSDTTLEGVDTIVTYDGGQDIRTNLGDLTQSGMQTVLLVFVILLVFVGFRESIIAALSIPLSFMLAFVAFIVVGNTINFISLFALILSIGILVDSAIVVVEGINSKVGTGMRRQEAAIATVREFGLPLVAGTMTTIAVFVPLLFLSGIIGQFIRSIPFTVILVLLASIFVSLGYVTVFCSGWLKNRDQVREEKIRWADRQFTRLEGWYRTQIGGLLQHPLKRRLFQVGVTLVAILSFMTIPLGIVSVIFFPEGDIEYAYIRIETDTGSELSDTQEFTRRVEELLQDLDYIENYIATVGATSIYEEEYATGDTYANITLNIHEDYVSQGLGLLDGLQQDLDGEAFANAELVAQGGGPPTGSAVDVSFVSDDTALLRSTTREAEQALVAIDGAVNINSDLSGNTAGFEVVVDRNAATRYGVQISSIAQAIRGATNGVELFEVTDDGDDVTVVLKNRLVDDGIGDIETNRITPDDLLALSVSNANGQPILLGSMVEIVLSEADRQISHTDGNRVAGITADVDEGYNPGDIRAQFEEQLVDIVPRGVTYSFGGEQSEQDESFAEMGVAFLAGIFLMFAILILQFGRWRQVLIIMSVLLYALAGVVIGLALSGNAVSFPAMLGTIALFGIVVNNSIILVSVFNALRIEHPDWDMDQVVIEGSSTRLRPILLTTVTTIVGVSPLLTASAIWAPIAYAIIFGLLFCVLVTLALVPILYRRFEGFRTGAWASVWSWWINMILLVIVPVGIMITLVVVGAKVEWGTLLSMYVALLVGGVAAYVLTHTRKHID